MIKKRINVSVDLETHEIFRHVSFKTKVPVSEILRKFSKNLAKKHDISSTPASTPQ